AGGGEAFSSDNLPPTPPEPAPTPKKKRWFGLKSLLFLMMLGICAAPTAIFLTMPNKSTVTGQLRFVNFDKLSRRDQDNFVKQQHDILSAIRQDARTKFIPAHQGVSPGFLDDTVSFSNTVSLTSMDSHGVLSIPYVGGAK